ncbi:MAG: threonine/serine exporter family protein [Muribaculaceae bacterium]|nr:threonine/serine exporter family protein [Muribaculaceae bacterium]
MSGSIFINIFLDGLFAAIAAIGFASISSTPRRAYIACAVTAAAGHAVRYVLMRPDLLAVSIVPATAIAALVVGVLGVLFAPSIKCPAEVCFFPALLPMVPGMYAYHALQALAMCLASPGGAGFQAAFGAFASNGLTCVFIVLAMVLGANVPVFLLKNIAFRATR